MDRDAPESTKKLKLLFVSWRKIKFFAGRKDMAVVDAGTMAGGGGGQQGQVGPVAVVRAATAGLLVFLICAAVLALLGPISEAGVVETPAVAVVAPGWARREWTVFAWLHWRSASHGKAKNRGGCRRKGSVTRGQPLRQHRGSYSSKSCCTTQWVQAGQRERDLDSLISVSFASFHVKWLHIFSCFASCKTLETHTFFLVGSETKR
jgi:hypothetical protein